MSMTWGQRNQPGDWRVWGNLKCKSNASKQIWSVKAGRDTGRSFHMGGQPPVKAMLQAARVVRWWDKVGHLLREFHQLLVSGDAVWQPVQLGTSAQGWWEGAAGQILTTFSSINIWPENINIETSSSQLQLLWSTLLACVLRNCETQVWPPLHLGQKDSCDVHHGWLGLFADVSLYA